MLSGFWSGKLGDTVGAKWKDKKTIRVYAIPSNPNTPAQQVVKENFAHLSKMVMLISDQLKPLSALNTKSMTLRNALVHLNKELVSRLPSRLSWADVKVSTGGLPPLVGFSVTQAGADASLQWQTPQFSVISSRAQVVGLIVLTDGGGDPWLSVSSIVQAAPYTDGSMTIDVGTNFSISAVFGYIIDYRGSAKVASTSSYVEP
jgi:hypothetical protein